MLAIYKHAHINSHYSSLQIHYYRSLRTRVMGKPLRLLTEKDLEGKPLPRDLFDSLLIAAQVARKIYSAEKLQERKHRCIC